MERTNIAAASLRWLRQSLARLNAPAPRVIPANVPGVGGFEFEIHQRPDQFISEDLARDHIWEPFETEVFRRLCRPKDFILDIGANIGWYSVIASRLVGSTGSVLAFEPDARNFKILIRNISRSGGAGRVKPRRMAVGDQVLRTRLFLSESNLGDHRLFSDGSARATQEVEMQTLDALLGGLKALPTLVKSDTQGSEARIVAGAARLLSLGWRPIWLLEFWPYGLVNAGNDPMALWHQLAALGYQMFEVSESNPRLMPLTEAYVRARVATDISPESMGFINILALPRQSERLSCVEDLLAGAGV